MLEHDDLAFEIAAHHTERPLVVEITEHQPVEDYVALSASLDRLRELGVRVAVDDVGSGFASFRHVTRVNPDILKLDRTLVCGIDDDPVRQSLASAIVAFAADVGAVVVSEGIESESELCCLKGLAVGCGQGFYLARPGLGQVDAEMPELACGRLVNPEAGGRRLQRAGREPGGGSGRLNGGGATSFGVSGWKIDASSWTCRRAGPSSPIPPPYISRPSASPCA